MTNKQTVTVAIGRNIGDKPMDVEVWNEYRSEVDSIIEMYFDARSVVFNGLGTGVYDGKEEESEVWIVINTILPIAYHQFLQHLRLLAGCYDQESIAVTRGVSTLLEAENVDY